MIPLNRRLIPLILALALALSLVPVMTSRTGVQDSQSSPSASPDSVEAMAPDADSEVDLRAPSIPTTPDKVNPLTGFAIPGQGTNAQRPVAIMLNNIKEALPQQGNSQADIIYEALAEGGITRMLGVYQTMEGVGEVGSIRSSRPYYLDLALGLDAIYVHAGGSDEAYADIKAWGVTSLDYVRDTTYNAIFWRDQDRIRNNGLEHSVLTSGEVIMENFPKYSFRKDHAEGYSLPYTYAEDGTPAEGESALEIQVPFSSYKTGVFTYDEESGKYLVSEYGKPLVDGNDNQQVAVTNVITIRTNCQPIDSYGRMRVDLAGNKGEGWFACGGKIIPITWAKADRNSPITYAKTDGTPLTFGQGNSYVNIIPLSNTVTAK